MIRNSGISLCLALTLAAFSSDSSGEPAEAAGPFEMPVADVFTITGRGVVVTGQVKSGSISVGDSVCIAGGAPVKVAGIEMFRKVLESVAAGDMGGLILEGISKDDVSKGDVIRSCD